MTKINYSGKKDDIKDKMISLVLNNKALVILILLILFFAIASPVFFRTKNLINVVRQVAVSSVVGVGFTMVVASGNLDLSVGRMLGLVGVLTAMLSKIPGMPMFVVALAAIFLGGLCGFINGFIGTTFRIPMFITTVAMSGMFQGLCYIISHSATIVQIPESYSFLGQGYLGPIPVPILIMLLMVLIVAVILYRMRLGRYTLAIGGNKEAARVAGVNVNATTIKVYVLMGVCVGVGALIMTGRASAAQPDAGAGMELDTIAAVVIGGTRIGGGIGNVGGTIVGCLMVGVIINGLNLIGVDVNWQMVAKAALIIVSVVLDSASTSFFKNRELKKIA